MTNRKSTRHKKRRSCSALGKFLLLVLILFLLCCLALRMIRFIQNLAGPVGGGFTFFNAFTGSTHGSCSNSTELNDPCPSEDGFSSGQDLEALQAQADALFAETDWENELQTLYARNPDTEEFVFGYSEYRNMEFDPDLSEEAWADTVPRLFQWDLRWGYRPYAGELFGLSGCGPTCLSMVSLYLLRDPSLTPAYIAEFSQQEGYYYPGSGSTWSLISEGGSRLGLDIIEIPPDPERILNNLEVGNPIICMMGPGDFTSTGHFIVLCGIEEGMIRINDPNSRQRSEMLWYADYLCGQMWNLWVCRRV